MDLSGSIVATILGLGLGDTLVGRDEAAAFPGVEELPVVTGSSHTVNTEAILALEPTLVITDGSVGPSDAVRQLADAGVTVVYVRNEPTFAGAADLAREVAAVYGSPAAGDALAARITDQVAATRADVAAIVPTGTEPLRMVFLYLRGDSGIYYMFGKESGAHELIAALGGVDAADDAGIVGMRPLTDEAMLAADPDVIMVMTDVLESVGGVDGLLAAKPAVALTTAGQHRRVVDMDDRQILAFGPRSADVVDALARAIYAPDSQ
jgi:iron complex transport system substrate-binding protein